MQFFEFKFLTPIYKYLDTTAASHFLQQSTYTFPVTEVIHLIGITMFIGAVITVCLRFLGFGIRQSASEIYAGLRIWTWISFWIVTLTGVMMIVAEPIKLSNNAMFPTKLLWLVIAYGLHFFGYLGLVKPGRAEASPILAKTLAIAMLISWIITGIGGRYIGFV